MNKEQKIRIDFTVNTKLKDLKEALDKKNASKTIDFLINFYKENKSNNSSNELLRITKSLNTF